MCRNKKNLNVMAIYLRNGQHQQSIHVAINDQIYRYEHIYTCKANLCKIESSIHTTTSHYEFLNVNILQIKGFDKTCFCKHMDKIYEIGVLSIYWKTFSIHCSLRKTIIALRRVLISKMCILSIICQSAMILYIQCWALIFNLLKSIVIVFLPYETICGIFHSPLILKSDYK